MRNSLIRTAEMLGYENVEKLNKAHVLLLGVGGVGGYVAESLARCGVGHLTFVDFDVISESNINRQIIATYDTVGKKKCDVIIERVKSINPDIIADGIMTLIDDANAKEIVLSQKYDYIVDAIDTVSAKTAVILAAKENGIPIISCMGTGNKTDISRLCVCDIQKTNTCPLARVMRKRLKDEGIEHLDVLFSDEKPRNICVDDSNGRHAPASLLFVPAAAGLMIGEYVINKLTEKL